MVNTLSTMIKRVMLFCIVALTGMTGIAGADETATLSLRDALTRGLESNYGLQVEKARVRIDSAGVTIEDARFDTTLSMQLNGGVEQSPTSVPFGSDNTASEREYTAGIGLDKRFTSGAQSNLSLSSVRTSGDDVTTGLEPEYRTVLFLDLKQPLLRDFGNSTNTTDLRVAKNRRQQAEYRYLDQAQQLAYRIEVAYLNLSEALSILDLRLAARELAASLLQGHRQKRAAGLITVSEVYEVETALVARDEQVLVARQQVEIARHQLFDLLEQDGSLLENDSLVTEPLQLTIDELPQLDEMRCVALSKRADLAAERIEAESSKLRLSYVENQKLPRLDLVATLGLNGLSGEDKDGIASANDGGYGSSFGRLTEGDGYQWSAGLVLSYPLGNRAASARATSATEERRQALLRLKRLENSILTEINNAQVTVTRGRERVAMNERFVELAQTTLKHEEKRLHEGLSDTFRLLDFQDGLIDAQVRRTTALADLQRGVAMLYRAMGGNLERYDIFSPTPSREL